MLKRNHFNRHVFTGLLAVLTGISVFSHAQSIRISEFMADNGGSLLDEDGDSPDWIELYNTADSPVSLDGWYLTDDAADLTQWSFPATTLPAKSFLVVFASDKNRSIAGSELHTNFKLSASGEYIALVQPDGSTIADDIAFLAQEKDVSSGYAFGGSPTVILDEDAPCTARIPTSAGDAAGWKENGFNDSGWLSGITGVGYEASPGGAYDYTSLIGLNVSAMRYNNATVYIRVPFTLANAGSVSSLNLKIKFDDAFVAYINGTNVLSSTHAPTTPGWDSEASGLPSDSDAVKYKDFDISANISTLQEGDNLLAIHGLNYGDSSSDLLFVPRLEATFAGDIDTSEFGILSTNTPGSANAGIDYAGLVDTPVTYPGRGFYDSPVLVSVSNITAGATVRYTLDGSEPTASSALYTGPITISSTINLRVRAFLGGWKSSQPRTDTYIFVDDVVQQPVYTEQINGQDMAYGMDPGVLAKTYSDASNQVFSVQDALKAIPSISITTDHSNLYDSSVGIYVNADQHWERPASAELINPDGSKGFHINAGLRIRGGYSRHSWFKKHSFRLFFRSDYGEGKLKFDLFEDEGVKEFDKMDLRTSQNYNWVHTSDDRTKNNFIRDVVCRDASGAMGDAYTRSRYYHLYLNGQYWGLFMTEERPVADYGESYFGGDADDYDVIKVSGWTDDPAYEIEVTDGTNTAYQQLYTAAMSGFASNTDYFAVQGLDASGQPDPTKDKLLDLNNLIDYVLLIDYAGASDNSISQFGNNGGINNIYAIYNRANPDGFKWIQHDCEHALDTSTNDDRTGPFTAEVFNTPQYFNAQTLHDRLSANAEYRLAFADRVYKHLENDGALVHTNMQALVDYRAAQIDRAILANAARWGSTSLDRDTWVNAVAATRAWFNGRAQTVIGYLAADGLIPSIPPPQISRSSGLVAEGTTVSLSEVEPPPSSPYYGTPMVIPGTIEAEDYDLGGPGIAYHDTDAGNNGGAYRTSEDVDVENCSEGGYDVGYAVAGEWMKYTVDVATEGDYTITSRVARGTDGAGAFHIEVDGVDVTGSISVEDTGGWQTWVDKTSTVTLTNGEQVVKLVFEAGGINLNRLDFTFIAANTVPAVTNFPTTIYYTTDGTDPRAIGGGIAGSIYSGAITITKPTHLKARVRNSNGEWSALAEATFWTPEIPLAVTELMYHAPDGNPHDYIEVKNVSDQAVTLKGYKLDNAIDFKFKNGPVSLGSGEYMVVVDDIDAFSSSYPTNGIIIAGEFSGDFSNGGEEVDLEFRNNDLISFGYSDARNWPQAADGAGHSLVPLDSVMDDQERGSLDYGGNWRASTYINGSPGYADPVEGPTVLLNEIIAHTDTGLAPPDDSNDKIELYNPTASSVTLFGWHLSDDLDNLTKFAIPQGTTVPAYGFIVFDEDDFHPGRTNGFGLNKAGEQVILSAPGRVVDAIRFKGQENGVSFGRYPDGEADWVTTLTTPGSANQPVAATVRISELMYNPSQPGDDYEYIQLENIGTGTHVFENGTGTYRIDGGVEFDFPPGISLPAGERLWILSFNPTNTAKLNLFCAAYGLNAANETFLGGYKGELSDRGERVALERPQDSDDPLQPLDISWVVVDELFYFDQAPWPEGTDGTGNPLVRTGLTSWLAPSATDTDGDQMPDAWEMIHFGSLEQALPDWDQDGFSNLEEYIADTDPTDPASFFMIEDMNVPTLYWTAVPGRTYSVFWTDDLSQPFIGIASGLTSGSYTDDLHSEGNASYYRIQVEME